MFDLIWIPFIIVVAVFVTSIATTESLFDTVVVIGIDLIAFFYLLEIIKINFLIK